MTMVFGDDDNYIFMTLMEKHSALDAIMTNDGSQEIKKERGGNEMK
jgi:hypothetical protein